MDETAVTFLQWTVGGVRIVVIRYQDHPVPNPALTEYKCLTKRFISLRGVLVLSNCIRALV